MVRSLRTLRAFVRRDWLVARSYRAALAFAVVDPFIQLALFFYLSKIVDQTSLAEQSGLSGGYFGFVVVGYGLIGIFDTGVSAFAESLRRDQTTGTLETMLASPPSESVVIVGSAIFGLLRAVAIAALTIGLAIAFFGLRPPLTTDLLVALVVALPACVVLFGSIGVALAGLTLVIKQITGVLGFVNFSLSLLCGVYYPITVLPGPVQAIAEALPLTWGIEILRAGILGGSIPVTKLLGLTVSAAVSVPLALLAFRLGLVRARREGSLALY